MTAARSAADQAHRPPIPASCADRPAPGGLVAPYANVMLADGSCDYRARHTLHVIESWKQSLCQVCAQPLGHVSAVLFGGPENLATWWFDEAPLCVPCALYASRACPMVAGRMTAFPDRPLVSQGSRGQRCATPGCDCAGWSKHDEDDGQNNGRRGEPAHRYYAVFAAPGAWQLTAGDVPLGPNRVRVRLVNGGQLLARPSKVVQVGEPGGGRVWRRLPADELAGLMPAVRPRLS
jgi:hypothetical protein